MPRSTRRKTHRDRGGAPRDLGGAIRGGPVHQITPDRYYDSRLVRDPHAEPSMFRRCVQHGTRLSCDRGPASCRIWPLTPMTRAGLCRRRAATQRGVRSNEHASPSQEKGSARI